MALDHDNMTVTATAAQVPTGDSDVRLVARNNASTTTIYLGGPGVSAANGFPVLPGDAYEWPVRVGPQSRVYAVTSSGTADLRWMAVR